MTTSIVILDSVQERYKYTDEYLDKKGCNFVLDKYVFCEVGKEKERQEKIEDSLLSMYILFGDGQSYDDFLGELGLRDEKVLKLKKLERNRKIREEAKRNIKYAEDLRKNINTMLGGVINEL